MANVLNVSPISYEQQREASIPITCFGKKIDTCGGSPVRLPRNNLEEMANPISCR